MIKSEPFGAPVFYEVIQGVTLSKWENALPLLQLRSLHKKDVSLPKDVRVKVVFPCRGGERFEHFSVSGLLFDDDPDRPYERVFLWLSANMGGKKVFAFMVVDLGNLDNCRIYFSPLPIGVGGKPQLPLTENPLLLLAMATIFDTLVRARCAVPFGVAASNLALSSQADIPTVTKVLNRILLLDLALGSGVMGDIAPNPMFDTAEKFFDVFGVKLPKVCFPCVPAKLDGGRLTKDQRDALIKFLGKVTDVMADKVGISGDTVSLRQDVFDVMLKHISSQDLRITLREVNRAL